MSATALLVADPLHLPPPQRSQLRRSLLTRIAEGPICEPLTMSGYRLARRQIARLIRRMIEPIEMTHVPWLPPLRQI
jgi:hypothetical protein